MITRVQRTLLLAARQLWFRAGLFSLGAIGAALLAKQVDGYLPAEVPFDISATAIASILGALASSMLAVTIFSLSTLVAALAAATNNVTPRARALLQADRTALNALSTFLGAFLFSLVGMIALQTGYYGERGRLVLFLATLAMVAIIVVTLIQWIDHVSSLGGVTETAEHVESVTEAALQDRARRPFLGGRPLPATVPDGLAVTAGSTGYLQHIDTSALQAAADETGACVYLLHLPGAFVTPSARLAVVDGAAGNDAIVERVRAAFTIAHARSFDQDPRFGVLVLSEIASRALSPAVNDPGTSIGILGRCVRLLLAYRTEADTPPEFDRVFAPALDHDDLIDDAFGAIARDGAANPDVGIRLQKALRALATEGGPHMARAAVRVSAYALALARAQLKSPGDVDRVERVAATVAACRDDANGDGPR